jgi:putative GTP pyrophosphokinase
MIVTVPIYLSDTMVNTKVEIQIRTIAMDFWASLEHKIYYKFEGNAPERIRKELKECADIVSFLDQKMLSLNEEIRIYNPDESIEMYKLIVSDNFQNMIKDSYGTVIDEEVEETTLQLKKQTEKEVAEAGKIAVTEEIVKAVEQAAISKENLRDDNKKKDMKDSNKGSSKDMDKKSEGKFMRFFGMK